MSTLFQHIQERYPTDTDIKALGEWESARGAMGLYVFPDVLLVAIRNEDGTASYTFWEGEHYESVVAHLRAIAQFAGATQVTDHLLNPSQGM